MISLPRPTQRILEALQLRVQMLQSEIAEIDMAWRETLAPFVPDGEKLEDYVVAQDGDKIVLRKIVPLSESGQQDLNLQHSPVKAESADFASADSQA